MRIVEGLEDGIARTMVVAAVAVWSAVGVLTAGSVVASKAGPVPTMRSAVAHDLSAPLRHLSGTEKDRVPFVRGGPADGGGADGGGESDGEGIPPLPYAATTSTTSSTTRVQTAAAGEVPTRGVSFNGVGSADGFMPPDPSGAVGPNDYLQSVNASFAVYSKQGTKLLGPRSISALWSGFGGPCENLGDGDVISLYDPLADRFLVSQFAFGVDASDQPKGPYYECIAVTRTGDPTGGWYRYSFLLSQTDLGDYPKLGVWSDGYYLTVDQFNGNTWDGVGVVAFDRAAMLQGRDASLVYLGNPAPGSPGLLPATVDGTTPPPAGSPEYLMGMDNTNWGHGLQLYRFHVDWSDTAASAFTGPVSIPTASFDSNMCGYDRDCIPQPGTADGLDADSYRLMYRLAYRNFGDHQSLVVNHTVDVDGTDHAGIRWYEIRDPGGAPFVADQGTYAPDALDRFNGSAAMDQSGDLGVGYSVSGPTTYPAVRYAGRTAADPPGELSNEGSIVEGGGSQTSEYYRWGDYSAMSVDPQDGCTFWYTNEYYKSTSPWTWSTRVGSFRFPSCDSGPSLSVDDVTASGGAATFTVSLSPAADHPVSVDYTTISESAPSSEYTPTSGTLAFDPGQTSATVSVPVVSTAIPGRFAVLLSGPNGAGIGRSLGTATIGTGTSVPSRPDLEIHSGDASPVARPGSGSEPIRTQRMSVRPGRTGWFTIVVRNPGAAKMVVRLRGRASTRRFVVRYLAFGRRVTVPVTHGRFTMKVPPHGSRLLRLVVSPRPWAPAGLLRGFRVVARSHPGRTGKSAVKAWVRVAR